jgi:threonine dehydratase
VAAARAVEFGFTTLACASTGNLSASVAAAAASLGLRAVVFVPDGASESKVALLEQLGAELHAVGGDLDESKDLAREHAAANDLPFFEDGAEPLQYEAYGGIADEILSELTPGSVVVPVGNGALAIGIFRALAERVPEAERIAVSAAEAPAMYESWRAGHPVDSERSATFADGLAVRVAIPLAVDALNPLTQRFELVSEAELEAGVRRYAEHGIRVEGAAAAPLAVALREELPKPLVLIVTGRNVDDALYNRILTGAA